MMVMASTFANEFASSRIERFVLRKSFFKFVKLCVMLCVM